MAVGKWTPKVSKGYTLLVSPFRDNTVRIYLAKNMEWFDTTLPLRPTGVGLKAEG
jgi:hypothetical protein